MWRELVGTWGYKAGTNGTVEIPAGATIIQIVAFASASDGAVSIFGGDSIPVPLGRVIALNFNHTLLQSRSSNADIVFSSNISSYFVEYVKAGNT